MRNRPLPRRMRRAGLLLAAFLAFMAAFVLGTNMARATEVGILGAPEGLLETLAGEGIEAGRFPEDGAARTLIIFNPRENYTRARDHPGPIIWWAEDVSEAVFLLEAELPRQSWRIAGLVNPRTVVRLLPGREPLLLPWGTDQERRWAVAVRDMNPDRFEPLSWEDFATYTPERSFATVIAYTPPPEDVLPVISRSPLAYWNVYEAQTPDSPYEGHLSVSEGAKQESILRVLREIQSGVAAPDSLVFAAPARPQVHLPRLRAKQARINLGLFSALRGDSPSPELFNAAETFLTDYKEAIQNRDVQAYESLWAPNSPNLDKALQDLENLFAVSTESVPHSGEPRILRLTGDPDTVRYRVQWWFVVVDRKTGQTVAPAEVTLEFTLEWDGERMRVREVSPR